MLLILLPILLALLLVLILALLNTPLPRTAYVGLALAGLPSPKAADKAEEAAPSGLSAARPVPGPLSNASCSGPCT